MCGYKMKKEYRKKIRQVIFWSVEMITCQVTNQSTYKGLGSLQMNLLPGNVDSNKRHLFDCKALGQLSFTVFGLTSKEGGILQVLVHPLISNSSPSSIVLCPEPILYELICNTPWNSTERLRSHEDRASCPVRKCIISIIPLWSV